MTRYELHTPIGFGFSPSSFIAPATWDRINKVERQIYLKNRYRVLLMRARQGMVLAVPKVAKSALVALRSFMTRHTSILGRSDFQKSGRRKRLLDRLLDCSLRDLYCAGESLRLRNQHAVWHCVWHQPPSSRAMALPLASRLFDSCSPAQTDTPSHQRP